MLNQQISQLIAQELNVRDSQILAAIQLLDDGNTIPLSPVIAKKPPAA
mgnify:CR=1 FL=1